MSRFFKDYKKYNKFIMYSAKSGLKSEVAGSRLGWIWWVLEPVLFMLVYWFIAELVFGSKTDYFPVYVFVGISLWNFFNKITLNSVKILNTNKGIVSKVYLPKWTFIMVEMFTAIFRLAICFVITIIMMIVYRVPISFNVLWMIPVMITMCLLTFGSSCLYAHFGVFVEDLKTLMNVVMRVVFYMSGVFYTLVPMGAGDTTKVPENLGNIMVRANPIAFIMNSVRRCLVYSLPVDYLVLGIWFVIGLLLTFLGIRTIYKYENSYVKVM